jgi:predicted nuclease of predicted toxin-antitoxin system
VKLLFDENLSFRLIAALEDLWPGSTHVDTVGLQGASDEAIWQFAQEQAFVLVSKDDDFRNLALVRGAPPKVVWLDVGNASTSEITKILRRSALELKAFELDPREALLHLRV